MYYELLCTPNADHEWRESHPVWRRTPMGVVISVNVVACVLAGLLVFGTTTVMAMDSTVDDPPAADPVAAVQALWQRGDRSQAHVLIDAEISKARSLADTLLAGRLLVMRGQMHTAVGDGVPGEQALWEGLAFVRTAGDGDKELQALRWLGVALGQNLKNEEAVEVFEELVDLARERGAGEMLAWGETGIAYQHGLAGEALKARAGYEKAVALFRAEGHLHGELFALNGLGNAVNTLQDFPAARRCYQRTITAGFEAGARFAAALAANNLGTLEYNLGDPGTAMAHFQQSYEIQKTDGNLREAVNAARNVAICLTRLGVFDRALELLDEVLRICRERTFRDLEYTVLTQKGLALIMQNRLERAEAIFTDLSRWSDQIPTEHVLEMIANRARALDGLGHLEDSIELMQAHLNDVVRYEHPIAQLEFVAALGERILRHGNPSEALTYLTSADSTAALVGANSVRLLALPAAGAAYLALDRPDSALACYQRAASVWERERQVPLEPEWRERRGVAGTAIFTDLAKLSMDASNRHGECDAGIRDAYSVLQRFKARTLAERMFGPGPGFDVEPDSILVAVATPRPYGADPTGLQATLAVNGDVLLDYFVGPQQSFLFAVTADTMAVYTLPPATDLADRCAVFRRSVLAAKANDRVLSAASSALADILINPAKSLLAGARRVIFCPDGDLHRLPLTLLLPEVEIQRVPSAGIYRRLRNRDFASPTTPVRLFLAATGGDGVVSSGNDSMILSGAIAEVAWLQRMFVGVTTSLADSIATPNSLAKFDLIHLATHAQVSDDYPWRSAVQVASRHGSSLRFEAADIARSRLESRLTVLAACSSGGGSVLGSEGVMGLATAFLAAGSPVVVASLWEVDDAATAYLMQEFYVALAEGRSVAGALTQAQKSLTCDVRFAAPAFWSGFVVIGDGSRTLTLLRRGERRGWLLTGILGVFLLLVAVRISVFDKGPKNVIAKREGSSHS